MNSVKMQLFYESNDEDRCWDEAFIKSVISEKGNCDVMMRKIGQKDFSGFEC